MTNAEQVERTVKVIWIRHGETADNARHVIQGHIDTPLNDMGIRQSIATRELLKDTKIDICFTSDLQRAHKTAEFILEKYHQDTPLVVDKRIKEKYLGLMEGQVYYQTRSPEVLASIEPLETFMGRLLEFWDDLFPSSNSGLNNNRSAHHQSDGVSSTTTSAPSSLLLPSQPKDLTVLVVTHGGPVKVSLTALPKQRRNIVWEEKTLKKATELKFKVWNCSLSEIDMIKAKAGPGQPFNGWVGAITKFADIDHLLRDNETPREGTEADTDIPAPQSTSTHTEAEKAAAERQYQLDNAVTWFQQDEKKSEQDR